MVSDGLFGNCQKYGRLQLPDVYRYHLTSSQRQQLESILLQLIESGYAWSHQYTQCVIANVLLAYRSGIDFDLGFCAASRTPQVSSSDWPEDADRVFVPGWLLGDRSVEGFPPEIRPPSAERASLEDYISVPEKSSPQQANGVEEFLEGLSSDDLDALEKYVADDLASEELSEPVAKRLTEPEEYRVVRRRPDDGECSCDLVSLSPTARSALSDGVSVCLFVCRRQH